VRHFALSSAAFLLAAGTAHAQVRVLRVPSHPTYGQLIPRAISGDGRVVVGYGGGRAMVWVIDQGIEVASGAPLGNNSTASGISYDGSIVAGVTSVGTQTGFQWNRATGAVSLLVSGGIRIASVSAVSGDGLTIVGDHGSGGRRAAFWRNATGVTLLPDTPTRLRPLFAAEVSHNGTEIVGVAVGGVPFAWSADVGSFIVPVPEGITGAAQLSMTANGDAIFGMGYTPIPGDGQAFTWNPDTGASVIPPLEGYDLDLFGASADGRIVVGAAQPNDGSPVEFATIRTLGLETVLLGDYFALYGSTHPNSDFGKAFDVADDGTVILGEGGIHPYWVAILPPPALSDFNVNNFVDFTDMMDFLDCFEGRSSLPVSSADLNKDGMTDFFDLMEFIDNF
jgi:uncharacterized membrane protein